MKPNLDEISLSSTVFGAERPGFSFDACVETMAKAGFRLIEMSRKHAISLERAKALDAAGLKVWSVHGTLNEKAASLNEKERRAEVANEAKRVDAATAVSWRVPYVVHYHHRYADPAHGDAFRRSVKELFKLTKERGLVLAIETAPYKPKLNERYPDSAEIAAFVRSFKDDALQATIDINHSNIHERLEDVCANFSGLIANVHISDNHGEWEDHLPPGEGSIDIAGAFAALRRNGYAGPFNLEFHLPEPPTVERLAAIRKYSARTLGWN